MKQFIIKIPEGTKFIDFDDELKEAVRSVNGSFPSGRVVSSKEIDGYEIKLVIANSDTESLENLFILFSLDWEVLAEEGVTFEKDLILSYLDDSIGYDEDGNEVVTPAAIEILQTYSGKKWLWN